jgi:polyphosphate glucokinase
MPDTNTDPPSGPTPDDPPTAGPFTLAIDVGGSGIKESVLDVHGRMVVDRLRVETPEPSTPPAVVDAIAGLAERLPSFDRVSVGFPGVVREGRILTAPNLGTSDWAGFGLADALRDRLGKDVRIVNDADMQGLAAVEGVGLEMVLTLGTGAGTALYRDGCLMPHLELGQHPIRNTKTYDEYIGDRARRSIGPKRWSRRVLRAIETLQSLVNYDMLHIGGGNATRLTIELPPNVRIVSNRAGILGGLALWEPGRVYRL